MKNLKTVIALLIVSAFVFGCTTTRTQQGTAGGVAVGALAGQALGNDTKSTLIGGVAGGLVGYFIGNKLDEYDNRQMQTAYDKLEDQQTREWTNPNTERKYEVTPTRTYPARITTEKGRSDTVCREAEILCTIDDKPEQSLITVCRDVGGRWVARN